MTAQPSRSPAAAARNTADSSSIPCGRMRPKNSAVLPCPISSSPSTPMFRRLYGQDPQRRDAEQHPEDEGLGGDQDVVGPHLEGERGRGGLGVVAAELVVDHAGHLRLGQQAGLHGPGVRAIHQPLIRATAREMTAVPSHHQRAR